jgi:hypothetical protein
MGNPQDSRRLKGVVINAEDLKKMITDDKGRKNGSGSLVKNILW